MPYTVAVVALDERPIVTRRIKQDGDNRGMIVYGYKFRPVMPPAG